MSSRQRRALTLSIGLAALLYLGVVLLADREAVFAALQRVSWPVLAGIFIGWLVTQTWLPEKPQDRGRGHRYGYQFERLARLFDAAAELLRPRYFLFGLGLGVLSWGLAGLSLYLIARDVGVGIGLETGIGLYAIAVLAGALSFLPGGLGGTEAVMGVLLVTFGADGAAAVAITLLCRIATL